MVLEQAMNAFAVRLYEWSLRDFIRELEEGCPLMSTLGLNNRSVAAFVAWNESLSLKERSPLARALARRCHKNALKVTSLDRTLVMDLAASGRHPLQSRCPAYRLSLPPIKAILVFCYGCYGCSMGLLRVQSVKSLGKSGFVTVLRLQPPKWGMSLESRL
jgi:hypothetical protein